LRIQFNPGEWSKFLKGNLHFAFKHLVIKYSFIFLWTNFYGICVELTRLPNTTTHSRLDTKSGISRSFAKTILDCSLMMNRVKYRFSSSCVSGN
jgi:hypothetical protein